MALSPDKLRHTLATRLLNQGMPIHSLQKLLSHKHLNNTLIYARLYDRTLYRQFQEATARLESVDGAEERPRTIAKALVIAQEKDAKMQTEQPVKRRFTEIYPLLTTSLGQT